MGILAEVFVAKPDAALEAARSYGGHLDWSQEDLLRADGITSLVIEILWAILRKEEWDPEIHSMPELGQFGDEGPWLFLFPSILIETLAHATPDQVRSANVEWAAIEEMGVDPAETAPFVAELQRLANNASITGRNLYLLNSL